MTNDARTKLALLVACAAMACLVSPAALHAVTLEVDGTMHTDSTAVNYGNVSPGVHVFNDGTYKIVDGGDVSVGNQQAVNDVGIQLGDSGGSSGHFVMTGGAFTSKETDSSSNGKHGYGLLTYSNSTFDISGGSFTATETGKGHNYIIQMFDDSTGTIGGTAMLTGSETSNGNGKGAEINDNASLSITGGSISHTSNDFNGSNLFILNSDPLAGESSTLDVSGGAFDLSANGQNLTVFNVHGASVATMSGGEVASVNTSGTKYFAQLHDEGQLILSGGEFPDDLLLQFQDTDPSALVTIYGSDFTLDGSPIDLGLVGADAGTLGGVLADDNEFSLAFDQGGAVDRILLAAPAAAVPEPSSVAIWVLISIALCGTTLWTRRRR